MSGVWPTLLLDREIPLDKSPPNSPVSAIGIHHAIKNYSVYRTFLRLTSVLGAKAALRSPRRDKQSGEPVWALPSNIPLRCLVPGSFGQTSSAYSYWQQVGVLTADSQELNHS